eukprot:2093495-Alexandrium_andersonii.AAC.1
MQQETAPSWFCDDDVMRVKEPSAVLGAMPVAACCHLFGRFARPKSRPGHSSLDFEVSCALRYLARPLDGLVFRPPFRCPPGSPWVLRVLEPAC